VVTLHCFTTKHLKSANKAGLLGINYSGSQAYRTGGEGCSGKLFPSVFSIPAQKLVCKLAGKTISIILPISCTTCLSTGPLLSVPFASSKCGASTASCIDMNSHQDYPSPNPLGIAALSYLAPLSGSGHHPIYITRISKVFIKDLPNTENYNNLIYYIP